jgi:RNA polymerase primary sigma factor
MKKIKITESITSRDESLTKFLRETSKYPLLTTEEEISLSRKARQGDLKARDRIVLSNARFLVSIAKKYLYTGLSLMDLISEGQFGLIDAVNRFDETRGFKLITFAVWHIRQHIHRYIYAQQRFIRLPANQIIIGSRVNRLTQDLEQVLERYPTQMELLESCELTFAQIKDCATNPNTVLSIDRITNNENGGRLIDVIEDKNVSNTDYLLDLESNQINLNRLFTILPPRQMKIVQHFFGTNGFSHLTLEEIADVVGLSKERTRQIKDDGMKRLSAAVNTTGLLRNY